jgi:ABC-type multidrug transport system permease subunit
VEKVKLLDYINLVIDTAYLHLEKDLHAQTAWYTGTVIWPFVFFIFLAIIVAVVLVIV